MADDTSQFDEQVLHDEYSDEVVRLFLFGKLPVAEQVKFEERLFSDEQFETRVRLAEHELADDYAYERLSATERDLFEQKFLVSSARRRQVRVSSALRDRFASMPQVSAPVSSVKTRISERLQGLLGLNQPFWKLALRVAILILLVGTIWTVLREPRVQKLIGIRRPAPALAPAPNRQDANHLKKAPPTTFRQPTPAPFALDPDANSASIMLFPQHGYDPVHIMQVGFPDSQESTLHILLAFGEEHGEEQKMFRAELLTLAGRSIFKESLFRPIGPGAISFDVPVMFLDAGDYQVKLGRVTDGTEVAAYYFRLQ
jgi:hypothetical protein